MKNESVTGNLLCQIPIFRGLDEAECRQLAEIATPEVFKPGEYVLREGQTGQHLWIVMAGKCEVVREWRTSDGGEPRMIQLTVLEPHANFGEMSFFHPAPHSASVRAITALELLSIDRGRYTKLVQDGSPAACKMAYNAVQSLADRIRQMDQWVIDQARRDAAGRRVEEWEDFRAKLFGGWNL